MHYYDHVRIDVDDRNIPCHPMIDQCNGVIIYRLLEHLGIPCAGKSVLDVGTGTGQVVRLLRAIPGLQVEACDIDPHAAANFKRHPELRDCAFHRLDFLIDDLPRRYSAIVCRGVYHHVAKAKRPEFIRRMGRTSDVVLIADEGILEYHTEAERRTNCTSWYGFVIGEAKRRGLDQLAEIEGQFLAHERLNTADDAMDFKESPTHLLEDAKRVGYIPASLDRIGPWEERGGGFFVATFLSTEDLNGGAND